MLSAKRKSRQRQAKEQAAGTILNIFGMTRPGNELPTSRSQSGRSTDWATVPVYYILPLSLDY